MARKPVIAANWKMHKTHLEAIRDVQKLSYLVDVGDTDRVEVVICPPFTALRPIQTLIDIDRLSFQLGAQNVHWEDAGAYTGEVSSIIRGTIGELISAEAAAGFRVQYGGSVKPGNIQDFMAHPEIDGALVGGASLDPEDFALIVKYR